MNSSFAEIPTGSQKNEEIPEIEDVDHALSASRLVACYCKILENENIVVTNHGVLLTYKVFFPSPLLDPVDYVFARYSNECERRLGSCKVGKENRKPLPK